MIVISILINNLKKKLRKKNLIQDGKIIYSDLNKPEKPLFSKKYRLIGKPDYIIKKNGYFIPVEVKSGKHNTVKKSHIYQLIAYCQLIEENYNIFTPYGIIIYPETSKQYEIQFNPKRRLGSSFDGIIIKATLKELINSLGEASLKNQDDKTTHEWIFTNGKAVITIYDFKENETDIYGDEIIEWHVGSSNISTEDIHYFLQMTKGLNSQ